MDESVKVRVRRVVAMPNPGRGHINPMLNLCKLILSKSKHIFITFVVTQEWLNILSSSSELQQPCTNLQFAAIPQVIPSEASRASDRNGFIEATLTKLQGPFERLLDQLEPPPTIIIYDVFLTWVVEVGNRRSIPVASFAPVSASFFNLLSHFDLLIQHGHTSLDASELERGNEVVNYIPGLSSTTLADLPNFHRDGNDVMYQLTLQMSSVTENAQYILITSIYELEKEAMDCLKQKFGIPLYNIGLMIPYFSLGNNENKRYDYFQWLDSQPKSSVLYISQGSFLSFSSAQVQEIIEGIKESGVRFLWVTRGDTSIFENGVVGEMGFLVPWCDQLKVLCHPSIGGFWTHSGWNSTSEGIYAGVPMLTCPITWDQFLNSKLIVNDLKMGRHVTTNVRLRTGKFVTRQEVARLVKNFMDLESDERKEMLRRAEELHDTFAMATRNGGSATLDLDAFINDISSVAFL